MSTTEPTLAPSRRSTSKPQRSAAKATHRCPSCGEKTKRASATTVRAMLTPDALARLDTAARRNTAEGGDAESYRFCASATCPTVYAREDRDEVFETKQVRLPVFQKTEDPDRLVCYCFRHSVREVEQDARGDEPHIAAEIRDKCRAGLDRCEHENPQGSCCLGNVGKVAKMAKGSSAKEPKESDAEEAHDCCSGKTACASTTEAGSPSVPPVSRAGGGDGPKPERSGLLAAGGAIVAAMLSSACCWLPLSLIALGVSAGSIGTFFDAYRIHFLSLTAVMLVGGFYFVYRKPKCAPGDACATPNRRLQKLNKVMLWTATAFVALFALFPDYIGYVLGGDDDEPEGFSAQAAEVAPTSADALPAEGAAADGIAHAYAIEGMSCEGCTAQLRDSLRDVPGVSAVRVSYEDKLARVTFAADAKPNDGAVLTAIEELGYEATVQ